MGGIMKIKGADILINCLVEQGVDTIFGYPGGSVLDIYDALFRNGKIHHVLTAHEQGAAHAADGYARSTGKVGVCFATSGPGATNLVTGIATAYMDSIPLVAITGNVGLNFLGRDSFQEIDIFGVTMPITKHNFIVKDVKDLAETIRKAFYIANSGRKGPVLVDILKNVQIAECEYAPAVPEIYTPFDVSSDRLKDIVEAINESKKPIIMAGGGVIAANAAPLLQEFAQKIDSPVAYTLMGKGCISEKHPLCLGMIGMHGTVAAAKTLIDSDTLIVLGSRFSDRVALNRDKFAADKKVIHIDIDNAELDKNVSSTLRLMADISKTLTTLIPLVEKKDNKLWHEQVAAYKAIPSHTTANLRALEIISTASRLMPTGSPLVTDVGQHQMWAAQHFEVDEPRRFLSSGGLGTMGFGMGAAIGAAFGTGKMSVLITGDGCFGMNMNEIMTAASENIPLVVLLMDNRVLGMVRQWQKLFYARRFSQTTLNRKVDYVALAESMGARGIMLDENSDVEKVISAAYKTAQELLIPVVVDCRISPDENVLPMIKPGQTYDTQLEEMEEN